VAISTAGNAASPSITWSQPNIGTYGLWWQEASINQMWFATVTPNGQPITQAVAEETVNTNLPGGIAWAGPSNYLAVYGRAGVKVGLATMNTGGGILTETVIAKHHQLSPSPPSPRAARPTTRSPGKSRRRRASPI